MLAYIQAIFIYIIRKKKTKFKLIFLETKFKYFHKSSRRVCRNKPKTTYCLNPDWNCKNPRFCDFTHPYRSGL